MFNVRTKYSYEDLDAVSYSTGSAYSRNIWQYFLTTICTVGIALFFLVLICKYAGAQDYKEAVQIVLKATDAPETTNGDPILVTIDQGELEGTRTKTRGGREYLAFIGIPYAKPPLGDLRFQPPVAAEAWNGTLNAKKFKPLCIQRVSHSTEEDTAKTIGSEDCLYINVYTPKTLADLSRRRQRNKLAIMAYVHGGIGGAFGNINRNGAEYLLDEDIVLVTFHYRLGVLGNLNTNDNFARGNQALKDQVLAFQWIQNNAAKFGGDNGKVTLFGESYGSMCISFHLISPMSKDLFSRAILQSGSNLSPGLIAQNTSEKAFALGSKLNCTTTNNNTSEELVKCLQNVDAETIILLSLEIPLGAMEFTMSIEPPAETDDVFLPDFPLKLMQNSSSNVQAMPVIFGVTSAELLAQSLAIVSSPDLTDVFNYHWHEIVTQELKLGIASSEPHNLTTAIREFYFGAANVSEKTERNLTHMFSDRSYIHPASVLATFQLQANNANTSNSNNRRRSQNQRNVYLYHFNKEVNDSYSDYFIDSYASDEFLGTGHADELQFLFPYEPFPLIPLEHKDANFSKMMVRLWASFADTGIPEGADNGAEWIPINGTKPYGWFQIEEEPKMIDSLGSRMSFWDSFNLTELYI